jgi:hypothetical protein
MKMNLAFLLAAVVLVGTPGQAQEVALTDPQLVTIREQVLLPFFEALKNGDVSIIKEHMSRDLYARNRVLLDENREYPAFLRNYYKDISFRVVKAERNFSSEVITFHVSFDYTGGNSTIHELKLSREKRGNQLSDAWVIEEF